MQGVKIEQAREALAHCLRNLNRDDRFNVIAFSTAINPFADRLQPAERRELDGALDFVRRLEAVGGTNIAGALGLALRSRFEKERPAFVVFITDGLPTVGEQDPRRILQGLPADRARIFPFGVGYDVNAVLLDQLAAENRGTPTYVRPSEDLQTRIAGFYDQIAHPLLTDLDLRVHGVRVYDLQPSAIPDLFRGSQLVLFGRYRGSGTIEISLTGRSQGRRRSFEYGGTLPRDENNNAFVGRLWATRRVGTLLRQIRLYGESRELVDEIRDLGLRFGIASPYTSFLVDENHAFREERWASAGDAMSGVPRELRAADAGRGPLATPSSAPAERLRAKTGQAAFELSKQVAEMISAEAETSGEGSRVRIVAGRTFHLDGETWTQLGRAAEARPRLIEVAGNEYFELLKAHPRLGAIFALGSRVVFELEGKWYETRPRD